MKFEKTILKDYNYYRLLRVFLRISTKQVLNDTGISRSTLWRFETGKEVMYDNVVKLNDYYNKALENE